MKINIREFIKRIWHDPVLSKVIAGLILGGTPIYVFRKTIWPFLRQPIYIQVWLFIIFIYSSIWLFIRSVLYIKNNLFVSNDKISELESIKDKNDKISELESFEEKIEKLIWKGQYWKSTCKVDRFSAFCPDCDLELNYPKLVYNSLGFLTGKEYVCEYCNKTLLYIPRGQNENYDSFIKREIEKRLRNRIEP